MNSRLYKIVYLLILTLICYYALAEPQQGLRVFEPKIITTNYDSLAPFLKYNGWEKYSDQEKIDMIKGWKQILKSSTGVNFGPMPSEGVVKSEDIAIKIAEIYLHGMYGDEIYFYVPYVAVKRCDSVWHVAGTPPPGWHAAISLDINANDGRVLSIGKSK
jgi:hypothetical protein